MVDCAHRAAVPAGGALAVDRVKFSELVEAEVAARPNICLLYTSSAKKIAASVHSFGQKGHLRVALLFI